MLNWINKKRNKKGFTLVELVVVIAILGILSAIAVPKFGGFRESANVKAVLANLKIIESTVGVYAAQENLSIGDIATDGTDNVTTKNALEDIIGSWPDEQPAGVTYTVVEGKAYATVVTTSLAWPEEVGSEDEGFKPGVNGYDIETLQAYK